MNSKVMRYLFLFCVALLVGLPGKVFALQSFLQFQSTNIDPNVNTSNNGGITAITIGPDSNLAM